MSAGRNSALLAVERTWLYRASQPQIAAVCLGIALLLAGLHAVVRWLMVEGHWDSAWLFAIDVFIASLPALLAYKVFTDVRARRQGIVTRLREIAELNHQVRNALDEIQLSIHITGNGEAIEIIDGAVGKIDRALREVLTTRP